jgi:class 3 adenylate cyclase
LPLDRVDRAVEATRSRWGTGSVIGGVTPNLGREYTDFCARYERLATSPGVAATMTRAMFACDARALLSRVSCPTLVAYNGDYRHIDREHSRYLAEHIADAELLETRSESFADFGGEVGRRYSEFVTGEVDDAWAGRQLAVVVFSDMVDSTAQLARHGDREWTSMLDDYHEVVGREVTRFGGRVVKQTGDGHLMTFPSPGAAISAVFGLRRAAHALGLSLRFGMHIGEIESRLDGDIAGIAVHTAARIAARAGSDEVVVSSTIRELLAGTGLHFSDSGEHNLKGLPTSVHMFSVTPEQPHEGHDDART